MVDVRVTWRSAGTRNFTAMTTSTDVRLIGGGGGGPGNPTGDTNAAGGSGGGAYAGTPNVATVVGQTYAVVTGAGGLAPASNLQGGHGQPSTFGANLVVAAGGKGANGITRGEGGTVADSIGTNRFAGGAGLTVSAVSTDGGGGGGAAGSTAAGTNAPGNAGGAGGAGDPAGGAGANSNATTGGGQAGIAPGGGASGSGKTYTGNTGWPGAAGIAVVLFSTPHAGITYTGSLRKTITLAPKLASITYVASMTKGLTWSRTFSASITYVASMTKRSTINKTFIAGITYVASTTVSLASRLIPGGSGSTTVRKIINYLFDD